ncbi:universal stress protein [Streptomyces neyagawaensis]|uniref:universal stress protein n=1 Tax=Streptomyces neyagawaensis TaxID=42238 RepID=UPI0006E3B489|nr:universal stress protein [Streptomyces neyagawaensis]MCL6738180.1 universal stress protein [Streptomyces neyagawaensis]MDE1685547.1 universal stress protein [Streptomyces neyagawaensis]
MPRTVTVGFDGSPESRAAVEWAAREARLRALPLLLVNVWEPVPQPMGRSPMLGPSAQQGWAEHGVTSAGPGARRILRDAADEVRRRHPDVEVGLEQLTGRATEELLKAAVDAELLVLGSHGRSGVAGLLVGSVGLHVAAHTERPVVLVRAGESADDEHASDPSGAASAGTPFRPVVLGLDTAHPDETLLRFAFEAAALRNTGLRVVHDPGHRSPAGRGPHEGAAPDTAPGPEDVLGSVGAPHALRQEFPDVEVVEESPPGKAAGHLVAVSREASLVVVGRRARHSPLGAHLGPVTHAVLHHAAAPVAVIAHG